MNVLWAIVIVAHVGAKPVFVEVWQTREPCEKYAKEIKGGICVPVTVSNKYEVEKQVESINELLK
jgi:hypothetical protein